MVRSSVAEVITDALTTPPTTADLAAELATLRNDLVRITETLGAMGKSKAETLGAAVKSEAAHLREKGAEKLAALEVTASDLSVQAGDLVRRNPGTALGAATALGFLVGLLAARR